MPTSARPRTATRRGMDKNRLELDRQAGKTTAAAAKAKAQFREQALDATDIAAIVPDEMMRLAYPGRDDVQGLSRARRCSQRSGHEARNIDRRQTD